MRERSLLWLSGRTPEGRPGQPPAPAKDVQRPLSRRTCCCTADNLEVLKRHIATDSIDAIYLDQPFGSNADYNVLFQEHWTRAAAQIAAIEDTWE